jgi:RHS repeat-associated protein
MKKHISLLISLGAFFYLSGGINANAQQNEDAEKAANNGKSKGADLENWTEEQIIQWEDSVKNALYPSLKLESMSIPSINGKDLKNDGNVKPMAVSGFINTYVQDSYPVDKTKAVGEIPISSSLSPTGSVIYNVPIAIYPGIRDFQPQLSVTYNNQSGNGIMGVGWSISGLSTISRTVQSIYYNGKAEGVGMRNADAFTLDGSRLIKLSETSTQIKYETEQGLIKVTANLSGNVVRYFDVFYPNGKKAIFGYTGNGSNYLDYPITSLSDLQGNTIAYNYSNANNHYTISSIVYNGASIEFQYITRTYPILVYNGGVKVTENQLLQKIVCKFGSTVLRTYDFTYQVQKYSHVLSQIGCSASSQSFNPLRFFYGEGNSAYSFTKSETQLSEWYTGAQPGQLRVCKGKFDYGTDDDGLISLPNKNPYWQHYRHSTSLRHSQNRFDNKYDGTEKIFLYTGLNTNFASPMPNLTTENGFIDIFCGNIDGKYEEEVIKVNNYVSGNYDYLSFKVYAGNLYSGLSYKYTRTFNFSTILTDADGGKSIHPKFFYTGDFNGDGKMEVLAVSCHNPFGWTDKTSKCYLFDLDSNVKLYEGYVFPYVVNFVGTNQEDAKDAFNKTDRLFVFDYDGDGKTDICLINDQGVNIYKFVISGSTYSLQKVSTYTGLKKADIINKTVLVGEFNGDGKPDLLVSPTSTPASYTWDIFYAMGNGQFEKTSFSGTSNPSSASEGFVLQDVNGDGLTDLIKYSSSGFYTYLANNNILGISDSYSSFTSGSIIVPTNINSRDYYSQLVSIKDGKVTRFSYPRNDTKEKLLTGMVNSFGIVQKNYYQMLNESSCNYTKGSGAVYPYENFQGPLFVPVCAEQYFNGQKNENNTYSYNNAVIHKQGLGFRGFEQIGSYDNIRGRSMTQIYAPYNYGTLKSEETPWVKNTNSYSVSVQSNKIVKISLNSVSSLDKIKNQTTSYSYQYDTYGNPTSETINYGGGITGTVSRVFYNNTNETGYLLGFLTDMTKTTNRNGSTWSERVYIPSYSNGLPSVQIKYANGNQVSYESFVYDTKGCITQRGIKNYTSSTNLVSNYVYDTNGRITKETNPMSFNTTFEYSSSNGNLSAKKNHKGQSITYGYDVFGRVISVSYPEGSVETATFSWTGAGTNGLYCLATSATGKPSTKVYYDALGRETRASQMRFNSIEGHTDKLYDGYGRLYKVSLPFTGATASLWNEYGYDTYDRPTYIAEASGKRTTYSYSGSNVTTNKDGIASTQTFDTQGNVISISDPAGTITYNLRPDGKPSSIVAPGSVTTSFAYDSYGRKTSIADPSAGTQSYVFDAAGNISRETDANGKIINFSYDAYNRLNVKSYPEFSTTYNYNTDGLLDSVTSGNGTSRTCTYDVYGRINTVKETGADNKWLQKEYAYSYRNISSIQYSANTGSIATENYSYSNGHLSEIKLNNQISIWKLTAENALGQPTSVTTGNFSRTYGYDAYGLPTSRTAGSFQSFAYGFDATKGNLTYRKDNSYGFQENFTYDNLNRLTGYAGITTAYDIKGNITQKTDVGNTFYYNTSGKPYAISGITTSTNAISQNNQSISYNSFKRPNSITEGSCQASFTYNANEERVKMELLLNGVSGLLSRYYLGDCYELDESLFGNKEKLYLGGDYYSAAAVYMKQGTGSWKVYYICRDYQGSITHITDSIGTVVNELSYDAWGRLRVPSNQTVYAPNSGPTLLLGRGYTGHEHLTMFGLVNMNARLYDPAVGRFLAPDPYVQAPGFSQNFNRYSYCLNNPLKYTDQDGEFWHLIIGAAIGGTINWATHGFKFNAKGLGYFGVGALAGALGAGVGAGISSALAGGGFGAGFVGSSAALTATSSFVSGAAIGGGAGFSSGFTTGFGNSLVGGHSFGKALGQGGIYGLVGGASGAAIGGLAGGIDAARHGRRFWDGATVTKKYGIDVNVISVRQEGRNNCLPASGESVDRSLGGKSTQKDLRNKLFPGTSENDALSDKDFWMGYGEEATRTVRGTTIGPRGYGAEDIALTMKEGGRVALTIPGSGDIEHSVVVKSVFLQTVVKVNGTATQTIMYSVMDPAIGGFRNIPLDKVLNAFFIKP